jgi:hypothetical protein
MSNSPVNFGGGFARASGVLGSRTSGDGLNALQSLISSGRDANNIDEYMSSFSQKNPMPKSSIETSSVNEQLNPGTIQAPRPVINTGYRQNFEKLQNKLTNTVPSNSLAQPEANVPTVASLETKQPAINTGYRQNFDNLQNELTNVPPQPSSLVQPFAQPVQQSANQIFGDLFARQNAVGAPMMFKINK